METTNRELLTQRVRFPHEKPIPPPNFSAAKLHVRPAAFVGHRTAAFAFLKRASNDVPTGPIRVPDMRLFQVAEDEDHEEVSGYTPTDALVAADVSLVA